MSPTQIENHICDLEYESSRSNEMVSKSVNKKEVSNDIPLNLHMKDLGESFNVDNKGLVSVKNTSLNILRKLDFIQSKIENAEDDYEHTLGHR